jgi:hypothetical protein
MIGDVGVKKKSNWLPLRDQSLLDLLSRPTLSNLDATARIRAAIATGAATGAAV